MINIDKIMPYKIYVIGGIVLIVAVLVLWNVFGSSVLPDNGGGADAVRTGLSTAQDQQRTTTDSIRKVESGLTEAGNTAHRVTEQLDEARITNTAVLERSAESENSVRSSGEIINRLEKRFQQIRERGKFGD